MYKSEPPSASIKAGARLARARIAHDDAAFEPPHAQIHFHFHFLGAFPYFLRLLDDEDLDFAPDDLLLEPELRELDCSTRALRMASFLY